MKRLFLILLAVMMLSLLLPCTALGGTITNITCERQNNGTILVRWDKSKSGGKYEVDWKLDYVEYYHYSTCDSNFYFLGNMIPGETYTITVKCGKDTGSIEYTVPRGSFTEWATAGRGFVQLSEKNRAKTSLTNFSLSDLRANPTKLFYLWITHPYLKNARTYGGLIVLKTPLGYTGYTHYSDGMEFNNTSYYAIPYNMMDDWLSGVENDYGAIPTGRYYFEVYLNGLLYDSVQFVVNN